MLPSLIQAILPAMIQGIVALTVGIIEVLPDIVQMIADMLPTLMPQIVDAILTIIPALIKCTPQFLKAGWELIKGLAVGIFNARIVLLEKIVEIGSKLIAKVKTWWNDLKSAGGDLIKGLWQGINDKTQWIVDKIKGFKDKVMNALKKFFGIASPSKEFAVIGKYNIMGLEEGMQKESLKLQDGFDDMFSLSPNLYGTSSTNLSPQINVINNISMKQDSLGQMVNDIKTFSGGAKNDYSYGMGA
jgi:phage-related protein